MSLPSSKCCQVAVVGGGPAGLMAAEVLSQAGVAVDLFDAMPTVGRKFLLAGKGGLNITHSEPLATFLTRYGDSASALVTAIEAFSPQALAQWVEDLGIPTFVGSSGRVFPEGMKAAPLLRAWLRRLRQDGVRFHTRHRWLGWDATSQMLRFATPEGEVGIRAQATILALGGGSWAKLGSDGAWLPCLQAQGIAVAPLLPANCGFEVAAWSAYFRERYVGQPLKAIGVAWRDVSGQAHRRRGECLITETGVEGSLIYALSRDLRELLMQTGEAVLHLDLLPDYSVEKVSAELARPRGARSLASHLQSRLGLKGVRAALLRELLPKAVFQDSARLATAIKALPLRLVATRPLDEAISSAGGVSLPQLDGQFMLSSRPGLFFAGEMLDWEAPTGGYLLTACMATGRTAGLGALRWLVSGPRL